MYIDKIVTLLQKYISDYEKKKYELESLTIKKQLYEELISILDNKDEIFDNKLFITVLLSNIYNDEEYNTLFYKSLLAFKQGNNKPLDNFILNIKIKYKSIFEKQKELKQQLTNASFKKRTAKKACFYLENRRPLHNQHYTFQNIKAIISYYAMMGEISEREEILLNNELDYYNNNIININNKEKEYKTRQYNEVPNILNSGFEMYDNIEISPNRQETINSFINDLKNFIKQINKEEIIPTIEDYQKYNLEINEYTYIVNEIMKMFLNDCFDYSRILLDISIFQNRETKNEVIETYYDSLDKYMLLRDYYNSITNIEIIEDEKVDETNNEEEQNSPRKLIFSHSPANPTKAKIIEDLKDLPEEYYQIVESLLQGFQSYKKETKSLTNNKKYKGFVELKNDQIRIILKHLNNNIYCIMGVFVKKTDNDRKSYSTMCNRIVPNINTKEKEDLEIALGIKIQSELSQIIADKARKNSR